MPIYDHPAELLSKLIRFDTTNPPGNEAECIRFLDRLLVEAGFDTTILAKDSQRPNLITRMEGSGAAPGLLIQSHVDVVTTVDQTWKYPPFSGIEQDGYIWGRGALDMKSGVAMMVCALLRMKAEGLTPNGDLVLCVTSDEEAGSDFGARFLVEEHAHQFEGIRYSIGEFGGFPLYFAGKKFYPIQVAEKLRCWMRATISGPAGHGSVPIRNGATARLGQMLSDIDRRRTPVHITPVTKKMVECLAANTGFPTSLVLRLLLQPILTDPLITALGARARLMEPLFRNTVSPTILHGGDQVNVIPCLLNVDLDGRMLPGFEPQQMLAELHAIIGDNVEIEILEFDPPAENELDLSQFDLFADVLRELDSQGIPIPMLLPGVTDARFFTQLGIQHYGFTPMNLPEEFNFQATMHAADERIPVEAMDFGTQAIYLVLCRYGG